jgi:hypothetical protein
MLSEVLGLGGWLLALTIVGYGTFEKIKTGRAAYGVAGNVHVERDKNPMAYWLSVGFGCFMFFLLIGLGGWGLYDYLR